MHDFKEGPIQGVFHQPCGADPEFPACRGKLRGLLDGFKKAIHLVEDAGSAGDAFGALREREQTFLGPWIIEPVQIKAQTGL